MYLDPSHRNDLLHRHGCLRLGRLLRPPRAAGHLRLCLPAGVVQKEDGGFSRVWVEGLKKTRAEARGERIPDSDWAGEEFRGGTSMGAEVTQEGARA